MVIGMDKIAVLEEYKIKDKSISEIENLIMTEDLEIDKLEIIKEYLEEKMKYPPLDLAELEEIENQKKQPSNQVTMTVEQFIKSNNILTKSDFVQYFENVGMDSSVADQLRNTGASLFDILGNDKNAKITITEASNGDIKYGISSNEDSKENSSIEVHKDGNLRVEDSKYRQEKEKEDAKKGENPESIHTINNDEVFYQKDGNTQRQEQHNPYGEYDMSDMMSPSIDESNTMDHTNEKQQDKGKAYTKTMKPPSQAAITTNPDGGFANIPLLLVMLGTVLATMVGIVIFLMNNM